MANNNDWLDAMIRDYAKGYLFTQMAIGCLGVYPRVGRIGIGPSDH
jgi:hypothetical protein